MLDVKILKELKHLVDETTDKITKQFFEEIRRNKRKTLSNFSLDIKKKMDEDKIVKVFFETKTYYKPEKNMVLIELKCKV